MPNVLQLQLAPSLDGGTPWRHALGTRARAGWHPSGPFGLALRLGKLYGEPVPEEPEPIRATVFGQALERHDDGARSYSASRLHDPFGVARYLLRLRDELVAGGWAGQPLGGSARLEDLAAVARGAPPGLPDVLHRLLAAVRARPDLPVPLSIELLAPRAHFPAVLRALLDALADRGARVADAPEPPLPEPTTDLGRLQRALRGIPGAPALVGDGTVLVLEAETPWQAADLLTAWQIRAAGGRRDRTIVVPTEAAILGGSATTAGLPPLGLAGASRWRPALQVLPLRLALAFRPRDPQTAMELLTLPTAPLSRGTRWHLVQALLAMPGVDGPDWKRAVERAVAAVADRERAQLEEQGLSARIAERTAALRAAEERERIDRWFGGEAHDPREGIPAEEAAALCQQVAEWAQGRARSVDPPDALLVHAGSVASSLRRMLLQWPPESRLTRLQLEQLHDGAVGRGPEWGVVPGGAGRPALCTDPAGVVFPAAEVVWWGFVGESSLPVAPSPWTGAEHRALAAAGVEVDGPAAIRDREAWGWRRPLLAATERVVLVRWRLDGRDLATGHPLEDELRCRLAPGSLEACTVTEERVLADPDSPAPVPDWQPVRVPRSANPRVAPRGLWVLPKGRVAPKLPLSATQIDALFSCPLRWLLQYVAKLKPPAAAAIPDNERLDGLFAHRLLQDVLLRWEGVHPGVPLPPDEARRLVAAEFDARVEGEAAPFLRPGRELDRDEARRRVSEAAGVLVEVLASGGWRPVEREQSVSGTFAGLPFTGSIDLVLRDRDDRLAVLDIKRSGGRYRRDELSEGRSVQLSLYARGLASAGPSPAGPAAADAPTAYFLVKEARLLTTSDAFPGGSRVNGPDGPEVLRRAEERWADWQRIVQHGAIVATHRDLRRQDVAVKQITGEWPPPAHDPPCRFCDYATLCTVDVGELA